ncbi:MAG: hypothetical protein NC122_06555 [Faecalibacterium sp.]|nr:hypothetical protein [Ruminococcus sp.]MCM1392814.1 hypothetical protein [Ruminococcus sp.]MCM1485852.1 hypothetical protein [Faecalibacterium sp.]
MKKVISVLLALVMVLSLAVPAMAVVETFTDAGIRKNIPVIRISGDGEPLYNNETGEKLLHYKDLLGDLGGDDDSDNSEIYKSIANVLLPFLVEGIAQDKWDNYYKNLQKEISELFGDTLLDKNGNPVDGTGISATTTAQVQYDKIHDKKDGNGNYGLFDYYYKYDWRLDPMETADDFNDYIKSIKKATNADKVGIMASCLGSSITMAYIAKYGTDDITGVTMDAPVVNGAEILSETVSGKFKIDGEAINRFLIDCDGYGLFGVDELITATIDLLTKSGAVGAVTDAIKATIYQKLVHGVTSALSLSTFYTWPNYWSAVSADDYQNALEYVFGPEGSEKREEYAGLIAKLDNYDVNVRQKLPELFAQIKEDGKNLGLIAKYGSQIAPAVESRDEIGDQLVSAKSASLGATTAKIYGTLSEEYIANRIAEGKGKYISPDKQIDASTCQFPDYTWFVKGSTHSDWTGAENRLLWRIVTAEKQITIDDTDSTQFMIWDNEANNMFVMTEENCNTYFWDQDQTYDKPETPIEKLIALIKSAINWLKLVFERVFSK